MEWLNDYRMRLMVVACVVAVVLGGGTVNADFKFGTPTPVYEPIGSTGIEYLDCISADGLEMYIDRPVPNDDIRSLDWDLYVSTRETTDDPWSIPVSLGPTVNSAGYVDGCASLSCDCLELYFSTNHSSDGRQQILVTRRESMNADWSTPENLGPPINTPGSNMMPWISSDGLELYFCSNRPGGSENVDIWVSRRTSTIDPWEMPVNLGPAVNSKVDDCFPCLSPDGLVLFFCDGDNPSSLYRPGGHGGTDMWMTRRRSIEDPWGPAVNLGPGINTSYFESQPRISPDGSVLYFTSSRPGMNGSVSSVLQAPLIPIVDFDADGAVDLADVQALVDHWGTSDSLYDIGPTPMGDGIVDAQDLLVLTEHIMAGDSKGNRMDI